MLSTHKLVLLPDGHSRENQHVAEKDKFCFATHFYFHRCICTIPSGPQENVLVVYPLGYVEWFLGPLWMV